MRQKLANGLHWLTERVLGLVVFVMIVGPFWVDHSGGPLDYYPQSTAFLLLSLLLFYLIWRFPHLERWNSQMRYLTLMSTCFAGSYIGWTSAPAWGLPHVLGHVLGILVGVPLGSGIVHWENRAINVRKGLLAADQHSALDA